jgi:hypothetical protein
MTRLIGVQLTEHEDGGLGTYHWCVIPRVQKVPSDVVSHTHH